MDQPRNETPSWFIAEALPSVVRAVARTLLLDEWNGWTALRESFVLDYPRLHEPAGTEDDGRLATAMVVCDVEALADEAVGVAAGPDDDFGVFFVSSRRHRRSILWPHPTLARLEVQMLGRERCRFRLSPDRRFTRFAEVGVLLEGLRARMVENLAATAERRTTLTPGAGAAAESGVAGAPAGETSSRSRRFGSRTFRDVADFRDKVLPLMRRLWESGKSPSQPRTADAIDQQPWFNGWGDCNERRIQEWCREFELDWGELVRESRSR